MRIVVIAISVVTLVSLSMWAQQPAGQRQGQRQSQAAPPLQGGQVTAADLAAIVGKQPKDRNGNQTFLQLAPYNVNRSIAFQLPRTPASMKRKPSCFT